MTKTQILHKGDIIINPLTSRPVKVGGTVWRKLVKQGLVHGAYKDPKVLGEYSTTKDWKVKQKILKHQMDDEFVPSRGRGKYNGKIVKKRNPFESNKVKRKKVQKC